MTKWVRFIHEGRESLGALEGSAIEVHSGDMFESPRATGARLELSDVRVLAPVRPAKFFGLWNNFHEAALKQGNAIPDTPLYFIKAPNSYRAHGQSIRRPPHYDGKIVYEGELGIVIGRRADDVDEAAAGDCIFGYTCVDDVTAFDIIASDASFAQWTRPKSCDTFGVFGPAIATGLDPAVLRVRTLVNGRERQNYPVSDMIIKPAAVVSALSREMTLEPGDVIACGTSLGVAPLRPGATVEIVIDGIGTPSNTLD